MHHVIASPAKQSSPSAWEAVKPYLLQCGFVQRTPRGRLLTPKAFAHLGMKAPVIKQPDLLDE